MTEKEEQTIIKNAENLFNENKKLNKALDVLINSDHKIPRDQRQKFKDILLNPTNKYPHVSGVKKQLECE